METLLEELSLNAWPAIRQMHYDNWVLRFSDGHTRRAHSVNVLGHSTIPLEEKIAFCEEAYRSMGEPAVFKIPTIPRTKDLDELLCSMGYGTEGNARILTKSLSDFTAPTGIDFVAEQSPSDEWIEVTMQFAEIARSKESALRGIVSNISPTRCFATLRTGAGPVAIGLGVVERGWVGLFDIATAPEHRRQGHGTRLMLNLMQWGKDNGAQGAYLQVVAGNAAAERLYDNLGFAYRYEYWYRAKRES